MAISISCSTMVAPGSSNDGKGAQLYDSEVQKEYQKGFGVGYKDDHPPYELVPNLRGLLYLLLDLGGQTRATNVLTLGLSILTYVITLRLWQRNADEQNDLFDLRFALALVMTVLVSFHCTDTTALCWRFR
jgi:hypothetical protein